MLLIHDVHIYRSVTIHFFHGKLFLLGKLGYKGHCKMKQCVLERWENFGLQFYPSWKNQAALESQINFTFSFFRRDGGWSRWAKCIDKGSTIEVRERKDKG